MNKEKYVEPIVTDADGNVYVSMKMLKEYTEKYEKALEDIKQCIEEHTEETEIGFYGLPPKIKSFTGRIDDILEIVNKALGDK